MVVNLVASHASFECKVLLDLVNRDAGVEKFHSEFLSPNCRSCVAECYFQCIAVWKLEYRVYAVSGVFIMLADPCNHFFRRVVVSVLVHAKQEHRSFHFQFRGHHSREILFSKGIMADEIKGKVHLVVLEND